MKYILFGIICITIFACGNNNTQSKKMIDDLPFHKAEDAKAYADLILKAIKTNRHLPVFQEFSNKTLDVDSVDYFVSMYSTGIGGRDDWDFIDVYGDSEQKTDTNEFEYAWLDPNGRLGIQLKIIPEGTSNGFNLKKIEFRSRLSVMKSHAFPGGEISNYEKIEYDWDAEMKRKVEAAKKG